MFRSSDLGLQVLNSIQFISSTLQHIIAIMITSTLCAGKGRTEKDSAYQHPLLAYSLICSYSAVSSLSDRSKRFTPHPLIADVLIPTPSCNYCSNIIPYIFPLLSIARHEDSPHEEEEDTPYHRPPQKHVCQRRFDPPSQQDAPSAEAGRAGEACVDDRRVLPLHCDGRERGGEEEARFSRRPLQTWLVRGED